MYGCCTHLDSQRFSPLISGDERLRRALEAAVPANLVVDADHDPLGVALQQLVTPRKPHAAFRRHQSDWPRVCAAQPTERARRPHLPHALRSLAVRRRPDLGVEGSEYDKKTRLTQT